VGGFDRFLTYYTKNIASNGATTTLININMSNVQSASIVVEYCIEGRNATNAQSVTGTVIISAVRTSAGAIVSAVLPVATFRAVASSIVTASTPVYTFAVISGSATTLIVQCVVTYSGTIIPVFTGATPPSISLVVRNFTPASSLAFL
jgi:hypothetical protein